MKHMNDIARFIELLVKNSKFHLLTILGAPGWAKTHTTRSALEKLNVEFDCLGSYSTPLGLYNHLCRAPDKLIVIDDTAGLFHSPQAMSLLNAASWPGAEGDNRRVLTWTSTSEMAASASFEFRGKIIVLTNFMPETPQAKAFMNRSLHYRIQLDAEIIGELLLSAADSAEHFKDPQLAQKVARFLADSARFFDINRFSLRTLEMGYEFAKVEPNGWQDLLLRTLPPVAPDIVVRELDASEERIERQFEEFRRVTGKSRRTFFYIRDRLGLKLRPQYDETILQSESEFEQPPQGRARLHEQPSAQKGCE